MNCLNLSLSIPYNGKDTTIQEVLEELTEVLGNAKIAYAVLTANNGYPLSMTSDGKQSNLHSDLVKSVGDSNSATRIKARIYSESFQNRYGSWKNRPESTDVDVNGEPILRDNKGLLYFKGNKENIPAMPYQDNGTITNPKESIPVPIKGVEETPAAEFIKELNYSAEAVEDIVYGRITEEDYKAVLHVAAEVYSNKKIPSTMRAEVTMSAMGLRNPFLQNIKAILKQDVDYTDVFQAYKKTNPVKTDEAIDNLILREHLSYVFDEAYALEETNEKNKKIKKTTEALDHKVVLFEKELYSGYTVNENNLASLHSSIEDVSLDSKTLNREVKVSTTSFLETEGLTGIQLTEEDTVEETEATYSYITQAADRFGITVSSTRDNALTPARYVKDTTSPTGIIVLSDSYDKLTDLGKAKAMLHAMLEGIVQREISELREEDYTNYTELMNTVAGMYASFSTAASQEIKNLNALGPALFVESMFKNKKMGNFIFNENPDQWDTFVYSALSVLGQNSTKGLHTVMSAYIKKKDVATTEVVTAETPKEEIDPTAKVSEVSTERDISIDSLSSRELNSILDKQFVANTEGDLKQGDIAKYSSPGKSTGSYVIIVSNNNGVVKGIKYSYESLKRGGTTFSGPATNFTKLGKYSTIEGNNTNIAVFHNGTIVNLTNAETGKAFVNQETSANASKYIQHAVDKGATAKLDNKVINREPVPSAIKDRLTDIIPDITNNKLRELYDNYKGLMENSKDGSKKAITFEAFKGFASNSNVYNYKDTYIFGQYDPNNNVFITTLSSSPNSKELLAEAIPNISEQFDVIGYATADVVAKYKRSGFSVSTSSFSTEFRGEMVEKFMYASNPKVVQRLIGKPIEQASEKEIRQLDTRSLAFMSYNVLKKEVLSKESNWDVNTMVNALKELRVPMYRIRNFIKHVNSGRFNKDRFMEVSNLKDVIENKAEPIMTFNSKLRNKTFIEHVKPLYEFKKVELASKDVNVINNIAKTTDTELNKKLVSYLGNLGIKVEYIEDIQKKLGIDSLGTVNILNRIVSIDKSNTEELPAKAGHVIAHMMQHTPLMSSLIDEMKKTGRYTNYKDGMLAAAGDLIARQLLNKSNMDIPKSLQDRLKILVDYFLGLLKNYKVTRINNDIATIVNSVLAGNTALIKASKYKPGDFGAPVIPVNIHKALASDSFATEVVNDMADYGFILTGSTVLAEQGTVLRPDENQVHDLDWVNPYGSKETENILNKIFPNRVFVRDIIGKTSYKTRQEVADDVLYTHTFLLSPRGTTLKNVIFQGSGNKVVSYSVVNAKGKTIGTYTNTKGIEKHTGVKAKAIDLFMNGKVNGGPRKVKLASGKELSISNWQHIMEAKLNYSRLKDIWDYNRFIPNEFISETKLDNKKLDREDKKDFGLTKDMTINFDIINEGAYEEVKGMLEEGVSKGTSFRTYTKQDASTLERPYVETAVEYLLNNGYVEKYTEDDLRLLVKKEVKTEEVKEFKDTPEVKPKPKAKGTNPTKYTFSDTKGELTQVKDAKGKVVEIVIGTDTTEDVINILLTSAKTKFVVEGNKARVNKAMQSIAKAGLAVPSNITFSDKLIEEKVVITQPLPKMVNSIINVKGISIDLKKLRINFELSNDQLRVLDSLAEWLNQPIRDTPFVIEGIAGTGKTTLLRVAREYTIQKGLVSAFTALTNAASINLELLTETKATTVHSILGITPSIDLESENEDITFDSDEADTAELPEVIFVDEISMASSKIMSLFQEAAREGISVVMIGSKAQLPPPTKSVKGVKAGPVTHSAFNEDINEVHQLHQVKRQGDTNYALPFMLRMSEKQDTGFRTDGFLNKNTFYNKDNNEGMFFLSSQEGFEDWMTKKVLKGMQLGDPRYARALTYTNRKSEMYNTLLRSKMFDSVIPLFHDGEFVSTTNTVGATRKGVPYKVTDVAVQDEYLFQGATEKCPVYTIELTPGFNYKINSEDQLKTVVIRVAAPITELSVKMNSILDKKDTVSTDKVLDFIDNKKGQEKLDKDYNDHPAIKEFGIRADALKYKIRLARNPRDKKKAEKEYFDFMASIGLMRGVTKTVNYNGNTFNVNVAPSNMQYGYSSTVHKAQGATYEYTAIDEANIREFMGYDLNMGRRTKAGVYDLYNKLMYTASTRASKLSVSLVSSVVHPASQEEHAARRDELDTLNAKHNSKTLSRTGAKVEEGTFHETADNLLFELKSKAKIQSVAALDINETRQMSLIEAVPNGVLVVDPTDSELQLANDKFSMSIAISETDARVKQKAGGDLKLYNQLMYDRYANHVTMLLERRLTTDNIDNITLNNKSTQALQSLKKDIRTLESQLNNLQAENDAGIKGGRKEEVMSEMGRLTVDISNKKDFQEKMQSDSSIQTLEEMADSELNSVKKILGLDDNYETSKTSVSHSDLQRARRTLDTWHNVGDFTDLDNNPFLDSAQTREIAFRKKFRAIQAEANELSSILDRISRNVLHNDVRHSVGVKEGLLLLKNKINWFSKSMLSIGKMDNPLMAHVMKLITGSNQRMNTEAITASKVNAELLEDVRNSDFDENKFLQVTEDGIPTGNMTSEYSYEYLEIENARLGHPLSFEEFADSAVLINPLNLLTKKARAEYKTKLEGSVSPKKADELIEEALAKYKDYISYRDTFLEATFGIKYSEIGSLTGNDAVTFKIWTANNSPVARYNQYTSDDYPSKDYSGGERFLVKAPKMYDSKGNDTGFYDKNYTDIQAHKEASAYYAFASDVTLKAKANFGVDGMSDFALGHVDRKLVDSLIESGVSKVTGRKALDALMEPFTGGYERVSQVDPVTGKEVKYVKKGVVTLESAIKSELRKLKAASGVTQWHTAKGRALLKDLYKEASEKVMKNTKVDMFMAINNLNMASLSYKYKNEVAPQVEIALQHLDNLASGQKNGKSIANDKDIANAKAMTRAYVDNELYSEGAADESFKLPLRYMTKEKKERVKMLEKERNLMNGKLVQDPDDYDAENRLEEINAQLDKIGGDVTIASILDRVASLLRFSTMGWNMQSAITNLLQGQIANVIMASSGKYYSYGSLMRGMGKLATENTKYSNTVKNYALLGDVTYSMGTGNKFRKSSSVKEKAKNLIDPYLGTKVTERANQGAVMIAIMLEMEMQEINDKGEIVPLMKDGEPVNMWDSLDENGVLPDNLVYKGKQGTEAIAEAVGIIKEQIAAIHGDYVNFKMAQDIPAGRLFMMFKVWFFDPFMIRFGTERQNYILDKQSKGRYVSLFEQLIEKKFNPSKLRAAYKNGTMSEIDSENMRGAIAELVAILLIYAVKLLSGKLLCDEEDKEKCTGAAAYITNILNRLDGEMKTFVDPSQWYAFISNPFAVSRLLRELGAIGDHLVEVAAGGDITNADGENSIFKILKKETPGLRRWEIEQDLWEEEQNYYR